MTQQNKPHHHGDLRKALVNAGIELLELGGIDALTLRKCAARAGVSHAAPAYHFNGIASLKAAIIARGHMIFSQSMRFEMDNASPEPQAQLQAICKGYLAFSFSYNPLFLLMFQDQALNNANITTAVLDELQANAETSYGLLQQACKPYENIKDNPNSTEIIVWSLVHGFAMLFGKNGNRAAPTDDVPEFALLLNALGLNLRPEYQPQ